MRVDRKHLVYLMPLFQFVKPPEKLTVSEWADRYRVLTPETCPEPGPYRTARTPYCKLPMDCFSDPEIEHIVFVWATQVGKSEAILNMLGYAIDQDPSPALLVMSTDILGKFHSRNRIQTMVEASDKLKEKKSPHVDEFTLLEMKFTNMVLSITGANSPSSLASRPVRFLFRDEVNKYPPYIGREADPMSLTKERTKNFWNRKIVDVSTPTTDSGNISLEFESCDAQYDYYVPCPHCGQMQKLVFENIKWPEGERDPKKVREVAWYECAKCESVIDDIYKGQMLKDGEWRSRQKAMHPRKVGFHLPAWYSPWLTWGDCAAEFLASKDYPEKLMNFRNSWEALPWVQKIDTKSQSELAANIIDVPPLVCTQDTVALTCGIDPGQGGAWFLVLGFKADMTPHIVHYGFIALPDPSWSELTALVHDTHYSIQGSSHMMSIWRAGIDTGGSRYGDEESTMTEQAYDWIRNSGRGKVRGTKGASSSSGKKVRVSLIEKKPGASKAQQKGVELLTLDTDAFKDIVHYRLQLPAGSPGRLTFHSETGVDLMRHILAEEKRRNKKGFYEWMRIARHNHLLDCLVIALALGDPEYYGGVRVIGSGPRAKQRRVISVGNK